MQKVKVPSDRLPRILDSCGVNTLSPEVYCRVLQHAAAVMTNTMIGRALEVRRLEHGRKTVMVESPFRSLEGHMKARTTFGVNEVNNKKIMFVTQS